MKITNLYSKIFSTRALSLAKLSWQEALESFRVMKSRFNVLILSLTDGLTKEWCIATHLFWKSCRSKGVRSGWLFLALYLKQSRVCLQRFCAGELPPATLSPAVSLTRGGIPRIIPSFHRRKIRGGDASIIQLYMSLFSLSKLIPLAKKVDASLFASIVSPPSSGSLSRVVSDMSRHAESLLRRYVPHISSIPLFQGLEFMPTWKAVPSGPTVKSFLRSQTAPGDKRFLRDASRQSLFPCLMAEIAAFRKLDDIVRARETFYPPSALWAPFIRYPFDLNNDLISEWALDWYDDRLGETLPTPSDLPFPFIAGRLCQACTGDGKRRLFAIGNYVYQRLLYPLHQWLASVLKCISMDGTFDQIKPLDRLSGLGGTVYSVDLKSATDRWPLVIMSGFISRVFGRLFASSAINSSLGANIFDVGFVTKSNSFVYFATGQPLGLYSSWPLFALSHHFVVWYAAEQEYPGVRFTRYAVLGDDIVLADTKVNARYRLILSQLGVDISEGKSITSPSGACEFAKRFRLDRMTRDVSPLSLKKIASSRSPIGWYNYVSTLPKPVRLSTMLRIGGLGFKASSRPLQSARHGKRARRLLVMLAKFHMAHMPLELCLTVICGGILLPQQRGRLLYLLFEHFAPKDIECAPAEVTLFPEWSDFGEYSILAGWMKQYLTYLKWYALAYQRALDDQITLDEFFEAPAYTPTWYRSEVPLDSFRFGVAFRIVDWYQRVRSEDIRLLPENHYGATFGAPDKRLEIIRT